MLRNTLFGRPASHRSAEQPAEELGAADTAAAPGRGPNPFQRRDDLREDFSAGLFAGEGIEIGGGAYPQRLPPGATARYYDLRTDAQAAEMFGTEVVAAKPVSEAKTDFPNGADFLIAHNVLEHCPDPIGVLIGWHRLVRPGGVVVISLPHYQYCPDERRRVPPIQHLVDDYLGGADGLDFPSREHTVTFNLGWLDGLCEQRRISTVPDFAQAVLELHNQDHHDVHWHAFDMRLSLELAIVAAQLDGTAIKDIRCWAPETGQTVGDVLISYTIESRGESSADSRELLELNRSRGRLIERMTGQATTAATKATAGQAVQVILARPFDKDGEFCFLAPLPKETQDALNSGGRFVLMEDGAALGPGEALHDTIRTEGGGAYSFWHATLYFSSSDGTDCNTNGRRYTFVKAPGG